MLRNIALLGAGVGVVAAYPQNPALKVIRTCGGALLVCIVFLLVICWVGTMALHSAFSERTSTLPSISAPPSVFNVDQVNQSLPNSESSKKALITHNVARVTSSALNVRSKADPTSSEAGILLKGMYVDILEDTISTSGTHWFRVRQRSPQDGNPVEGWVNANFVEQVSP